MKWKWSEHEVNMKWIVKWTWSEHEVNSEMNMKWIVKWTVMWTFIQNYEDEFKHSSSEMWSELRSEIRSEHEVKLNMNWWMIYSKLKRWIKQTDKLTNRQGDSKNTWKSFLFVAPTSSCSCYDMTINSLNHFCTDFAIENMKLKWIIIFNSFWNPLPSMVWFTSQLRASLPGLFGFWLLLQDSQYQVLWSMMHLLDGRRVLSRQP